MGLQSCAFLHTVVASVLLSQSLARSELLGGAFKICRRSDPDLNQCVVDSINGAKEELAKGIPELGLPPFANLYVDEMKFAGGPEEMHFEGIPSNCTWDGFDNFTVTRAKVNLAKSYLEIVTFQSRLKLAGHYLVNGSLLSLRIFGEGEFELEMMDVNATHRILLDRVQRDGVTHWKVKRYQWAWNMSDLKADIKDLYGGNRRLTLYANQFINSFWRPILEIYKDTFYDGFGEYLGRLANKLFEVVPEDKLFLP